MNIGVGTFSESNCHKIWGHWAAKWFLAFVESKLYKQCGVIGESMITMEKWGF